MSRVTLYAPKVPGKAPEFIGYYDSVDAASEAAQQFSGRKDLRRQDVQIRDAQGEKIITYDGPAR